MANKKVGLSVELKALDKITQPIRLINKRLERSLRPLKQFRRGVSAIGRQTGFSRLTKSVKRTSLAVKSLNRATGKVARRMAIVSAAGIGLAGSIGFVGTAIAKTGIQFEKAELKFETFFGADIGGKLLGNLRKLGRETTFTTSQFIRMSDTLVSLNSELKPTELLELTKTLGDIAALTGANTEQLAVSVGQSSSRLAIETRDLKELATRGVPVFKLLAKEIRDATGKTMDPGQIQKLVELRKISGSFLVKALRNSTKEGGKFFRGLEIFAETTSGKISQFLGFIDEISIRLFGTRREAGLLKPFITDVFVRLREVAESIANALEKNKKGVKKWGEALASLVPTSAQVQKFLKEFPNNLRKVKKELQPLIGMVRAVTSRFGVARTVIGAFALIIGAPMITAVATLSTSLISLGFSVASIALKIPAALQALSLLRVKILIDVVPAIAKFAAVIKTLGLSLLTTIGPILAVVAAVVTLIAVGVQIGRNWDKLTMKWNTMSDAGKNFVRVIAMIFAPITLAITGIVLLWKAGEALVNNWRKVGAFFSGFWKGFKDMVKSTVDFMGPIGKALVLPFLPLINVLSFISKKITEVLKKFEVIKKVKSFLGSIGKGAGEAFDLAKTGLGFGDDDKKPKVKIINVPRIKTPKPLNIERPERTTAFENKIVSQLETGRQNVNVQTNSRVIVDFNGLPEGARVSAESDRNSEIELNLGNLRLGF